MSLLRKTKVITAIAMVMRRKIAGTERAAATPQDLAAARSCAATDVRVRFATCSCRRWIF